ncbi:CPBP family intramembrane glutamic endopeptidase [Mycobacteroides abscessus]|nr:CPBP family intramembrane glutamic endopeptidase [Mycobacteroides abscessus]
MKGVALFCTGCFALAAYRTKWPTDGTAWATLALVAVSAAAFAILITYHDPDCATARILVYASAVAQTQGVPIAVALSVFSRNYMGKERPLVPEDILIRLAQAALSVAAFYVVKAWTKQRLRQPNWPDTSPQKSPWMAAAAFGTAISLSFLMQGPASWARVAITAAGDTDFGAPHADTGNTLDWWLAIGSSALAGVHEEPVYVGLALLLWPYRGSMTALIPVAIGTSFARSLMHVYYAAGQPNPTVALLAVFIWCAVWSTANLAITYRMKTLIPVIIAHGLWDIYVTNQGSWDIQGPLAALTHWALMTITQGGLVLWLCALVVVKFVRWLRKETERSSQLRQTDPTLRTFDQIRADLGLSHSQMLKAAGINGREFRSWLSKPLYMRPWDHPPQQFLALKSAVAQLHDNIGPDIGDWIKSDPERSSALLSGRFEALLAMTPHQEQEAVSSEAKLAPPRHA